MTEIPYSELTTAECIKAPSVYNFIPAVIESGFTMEPLVSTTLNVERLTQNGPIKSTVQIDLPLDTPFADLAPRIRPNVDLAPADISVSLASKISVLVTDGPSNHNPTMSEGLKINFNEPLVSWYKAYRRTVGLAPQATNSSDSEIRYTGILNVNQDGSTLYQQNDLITVGAATFTFNRTLRVPDDAKSYALPPALGTLPWVKAQNYSSSLPEYIAQRGGYIMPLFQREAMWIRIYGDTCAIKISVGGINAITGHKQDEEPPKGIQDYVVGGRQPWLDGIAVESGVVRQFVAMNLGQGYTIEEQLSHSANGGIQIDVFPSLLEVVHFVRDGDHDDLLDLNKSTGSLNIQPGELLLMTSTQLPSFKTLGDVVRFATTNPVLDISYREFPPSPASNSNSMRISVVNSARGIFYFIVDRSDTIGDVKRLIEIMDGIHSSRQQLVFNTTILEDDRTLSDYSVQREDQIHLTLLPTIQIFVKPADEEIFTILVDLSDTISMVKSRIQEANGSPVSSQILAFSGRYLDDAMTLHDYQIKEGSTLDLQSAKHLRGAGCPPQSDARMGIAAGGKIIQKIYRDTNSTLVYDEENPLRVFIHTVPTDLWETITGVVCPLTPITPAFYKAYNYPWFALYDEHLPTVQTTRRFDSLQSVHERDYVTSTELVNPRSPPDCALHKGRTSTCIARPCSHQACAECFGNAIFSGWKCPVCTVKIDQHVGFDKPVPKVSSTTDSTKHSWWEAENQIQGVLKEDGKVITLMLEEDRISGLHGAVDLVG